MVFFQQRFSTDYCGVYAAAMLCHELGYPVSKKDAFRALGGRAAVRQGGGVTLEQMAMFLRRVGCVARPEWHSWSRVDHGRIRRFLQTAAPTLLMLRVHNPEQRVSAWHVLVARGIAPGAILLLDSLGPRPSALQRHNAVWHAGEPAIHRRYRVVPQASVFALVRS